MLTSFVCIRGSIPLYWSEAEQALAFKPKPELGEADTHIEPLQLHMQVSCSVLLGHTFFCLVGHDVVSGGFVQACWPLFCVVRVTFLWGVGPVVLSPWSRWTVWSRRSMVWVTVQRLRGQGAVQATKISWPRHKHHISLISSHYLFLTSLQRQVTSLPLRVFRSRSRFGCGTSDLLMTMPSLVLVLGFAVADTAVRDHRAAVAH